MLSVNEKIKYNFLCQIKSLVHHIFATHVDQGARPIIVIGLCAYFIPRKNIKWEANSFKYLEAGIGVEKFNKLKLVSIKETHLNI